MKKLIVTLCALFMLSAYAEWKTELLNDGQQIQLFNDISNAHKDKSYKWLPLINNSVWM